MNYLNISYEYEKEIGYGPGMVWQIMRFLAERLNLTYVIKTVDMNTDVRWEDAFAILKSNEADVIVGASIMQSHVNKNVSFTLPFLQEQTGLIYRVSEEHLFNSQDISFSPIPIQVKNGFV